MGPFSGLFGRPPGLVWAQISVLRRVPGYTPGPKVSKMEALRPLLPILAISAKFHTYAREISNLLPNSGREKRCEILCENLERPVRIFQKCVSLGSRTLSKLFSGRGPNSHAACLEAFWDPPGQFSHQFSHKFHTILTHRAGRPFGGLLGTPGGGQAKQSSNTLCMNIWVALAAPGAHAWQRCARCRAS